MLPSAPHETLTLDHIKNICRQQTPFLFEPGREDDLLAQIKIQTLLHIYYAHEARQSVLEIKFQRHQAADPSSNDVRELRDQFVADYRTDYQLAVADVHNLLVQLLGQWQEELEEQVQGVPNDR